MLFFYERNALIKEKNWTFFLPFKILLIDFNFDIFFVCVLLFSLENCQKVMFYETWAQQTLMR